MLLGKVVVRGFPQSTHPKVCDSTACLFSVPWQPRSHAQHPHWWLDRARG